MTEEIRSTHAAPAQLRADALGDFLTEWQAEYGAFTEAEIAAAEIRAGYRPNDEASPA